MPGRRPKPSAIKRREGNRGKRKLNEREPDAPIGEPPMPVGLAPDAVKEWRRIVPELLTLGVLSSVDRTALEGYCAAYARYRQAQAAVKKYGLVVEEPVIDPETGQQRKLGKRFLVRLKANPAAAKASDAMKLMKSFLIEFGMSPASRSRVETMKDVSKKAAPEDSYFENESRSGHSIQ